jgi:hypothetical protein
MTSVSAEVIANANHNAEYTAADTVNHKIMDVLE